MTLKCAFIEFYILVVILVIFTLSVENMELATVKHKGHHFFNDIYVQLATDNKKKIFELNFV